MAATQTHEALPTWIGICLSVLLALGLAWAFLTANIIAFVVILVSVGLTAFTLHLFYRLVRAVERIAERM
ncbi:hypothetical protein [Halosolutus gelatinilyticus]|uniref:hypothetical protein n=1 Tax=Halosolutus gelatinilyticus TaxID=2931975 RepID=UPI001FF5A1BE|nr:hypothetical protein [Halosolutus gelatinilyticus]